MLQRRPLDHRGVSEVIGTILILLITVILFSTIVLWVFTLPAPRAQGNVGIDGGLEGRYVAGSWSGAYVNLTHLGGDDLLDTNTRIYLTIDNLTHTFRTNGSHFDGVSVKAYGVNGPDVHWNIGETWSYANETIPQTGRISILIVDVVRGTVVWDQVLLGEGGERMPVFLEKWMDSEPSSPSRDPVGVDDTFAIYVRVGDPDGDLNPASVWGYITFGYGAPLGYVQLLDNGDPIVGDALAGDGVFSRALSFAALQSWDGGIIILNATDMGGREAQTRLIFEVLDLGGGGSPFRGPEGLALENDLQLYDIFNATEWDTNGYDANGTRTFRKGETVVIVVASQQLKNADLQNDVFLYSPSGLPQMPVVYGPTPYNDPVTRTTLPSSTRAFSFLGFVGGFSVYEFRFSTNSSAYGWDGVQLAAGPYSVAMEIRTNNVPSPNNRFATSDSILVTEQNGSAPDYPRLEFFADAAHTQPTNTFNTTDIMYVKVTVLDTDAGFTFGDVVISDYESGVQVWATPGNDPVSPGAVNDSRSYSFNVDLSTTNLDPWLFGTNAYGFRIKRVVDFNEEYALTGQIIVRGARWDLDVITALNEYTFRWFGDDETWYATFYENDGAWSRTVMESFRQDCFLWFCSGRPPFGGGDFLDVALGDLDEDSDLDAVYGLEVGRVLWYRNTVGDGSQWTRYEIDNLADRVEGVAIGRLDRDSDNDIAAGTSSGEVWVYTNDGEWTPSLIASLPTAINVVKIADVYPAGGDGFNDILVGTANGEVQIFRNNGFGIFGTQLTTDYDLAVDILVEGNVTGSVGDTRASDDTYEAIEEVLGPGEVWDFYFPITEILSQYDIVFSGSYLDTWSDDSVYEILQEELYDPFFGTDRYLMKNSSGGAQPGHQYYIGSVPALGPDDLAILAVDSFISEGGGVEPFEIGYKTGPGGVTVLGTITETEETLKFFDLGGAGFGGGDLYIVIQDTDTSLLDENTDGLASRVSVDQVVVLVARQQGTTSRLEHQWRSFTVGGGGDAYKLFIEAHHTLNTESDDFVIEGSLAAAGPWSSLITVTKTADNDAYQTANLPKAVGGLPLYLRVKDANRDPNATDIDTVYVDHMFVRRYITDPDEEIISVGSAVNDLVVADMDGDGDNDIVVGAGSTVRVYYAPAWGSISLGTTGTVNGVDVGYLDADGTYDIAAGTQDNRVYWWANDGTWTRSLIHTNQDDVRSLRVADLDGDYWDDIVIATEDGYIRWYRHNKGVVWNVIVIENLGTRIYAIDVGDVDRGVLIDPSL